MTSRNDITGDKIQTKVVTQEYRENYDKIFKKDQEKCCGKCSPCSGHEVENQKEEMKND